MESADNQEKPRSGIEPVDTNDNDERSLSKIETIALINDSIDQLEQTIKGISENTAPMPSSDSINTLLTTTQELADTVAVSDSASAIPGSEIAAAPEIKTTTTADQAASSPASAIPGEQTIPESVKKTKNKSYLPLVIVIILAIAIAALYWLWLPRQEGEVTLPSKSLDTEVIRNFQPNDDDELAKTPLDEISGQSSTSAFNYLNSEANLTNSNLINSDDETPIEVLIPANLESPGRAKNLKIVTIEPKLSFTPEQNLIATLKTKIAQLTEDYPADLIDSVKVDLAHNRLLVQVTDQWYQLDESAQNTLANEMLERCRQFSFQQLKLQDKSGILVARNPVVGTEIVILERYKQ